MRLSRNQVLAHVEVCSPVVLRWDKNSDTMELKAMNFGRSKGSTHDHVLIFPTKTMLPYVKSGNDEKLADGTRSKLYVAITRARFSVAIVVD
jgi:DNA helicase-2/ATP-dependent DNA helicase PcrA